MHNVMSSRNVFFVSVLYLMSGAIIWGGNGDAGRDIWLALLINLIIFLTIVLFYGHIIKNHPGKNLFELLRELTPKPICAAIAVLYTTYAFLIGAMCFWNYGQFVKLNALRMTEKYVIIAFLAVTCLYAVKKGMKAIGLYASFIFPAVMIFIAITLSISIKSADITNLLPILYDKRSFAFGAFTMTAYPFGDTILLFSVYSGLQRKDKIASILAGAIVCAFGIIMLIMLRNVMVLGDPLLQRMSYATYHAVGVVGIGDFFKRIEVLLTFSVVFCDVIKGSVCILFACQGLKELFRLRDEKIMAVPATFFVYGLSLIIFKTNLQMDEFLLTFRYISLPIQIFCPFILWIAIEIRKIRTHV